MEVLNTQNLIKLLSESVKSYLKESFKGYPDEDEQYDMEHDNVMNDGPDYEDEIQEGLTRIVTKSVKDNFEFVKANLDRYRKSEIHLNEIKDILENDVIHIKGVRVVYIKFYKQSIILDLTGKINLSDYFGQYDDDYTSEPQSFLTTVTIDLGAIESEIAQDTQNRNERATQLNRQNQERDERERRTKDYVKTITPQVKSEMDDMWKNNGNPSIADDGLNGYTDSKWADYDRAEEQLKNRISEAVRRTLKENSDSKTISRLVLDKKPNGKSFSKKIFVTKDEDGIKLDAYYNARDVKEMLPIISITFGTEDYVDETWLPYWESMESYCSRSSALNFLKRYWNIIEGMFVQLGYLNEEDTDCPF